MSARNLSTVKRFIPLEERAIALALNRLKQRCTRAGLWQTHQILDDAEKRLEQEMQQSPDDRYHFRKARSWV